MLFALWSDFVTFMTSVNLSHADAMVAPGHLFSMLPVDGTPDQSETDVPDTSSEGYSHKDTHEAALGADLERFWARNLPRNSVESTQRRFEI